MAHTAERIQSIKTPEGPGYPHLPVPSSPKARHSHAPSGNHSPESAARYMTTALLLDILSRDYALSGTITPLGGENSNYLVTLADGSRSVLKIAGSAQSGEFLELEHAATEAVATSDIGLAVPRIQPTIRGAIQSSFTDETGREARARLIRFVEGTPWLDVPLHGSELRKNLGRLLASIELVLGRIDTPAARRTHQWDLTQAHIHRRKTGLIADLSRRMILHEAFAMYEGCARPFLAGLPHSYVHADANDENLLVEGDRIVGLLDFGDSLHNPTVCDLAISLAYVLMGEDDPLGAGAEIVEAYHAVRPLSRQEIEVLFPLVCGRLATTCIIAAERRLKDPDHPDWFITEERAWKTVGAYVGISPVDAASKLASLIDVKPYPDQGAPLAALRKERGERFSPALSLSFSDPVKFVRGRGQFLFDENDRPYLDLYNNVCHVGHTHPRVVRAGQEQMARLNTNSRYAYDAMTEYAERLCKTLPDALSHCFFLNSGSEANELALRLAWTYTGRKDLLVVEGAYHGHTNTLIDISPYKFMGPGGSGRPKEWVHIVPMADGYRGRYKGYDRKAGKAYADEVAGAIRKTDRQIAGFITESVWSCGGQVVPPEGYLEEAFAHVRKAGGVCIVDEVQVGFGRVGKTFWGFQLQNVVPDIVVMGKPIGNGHPLGAVVTTQKIAEAFGRTGMEFFSTFGGNPVSCRIGTAVLDVVQDEGLQQHADVVGEKILAGLRNLMDRHAIIGDVRGVGLVIGIELVKDRETLEPATEEAKRVVDALRERRVLTGTDGLFDNVVKIKPPIILDEADADMAIDVIDRVLSDIV